MIASASDLVVTHAKCSIAFLVARSDLSNSMSGVANDKPPIVFSRSAAKSAPTVRALKLGYLSTFSQISDGCNRLRRSFRRSSIAWAADCTACFNRRASCCWSPQAMSSSARSSESPALPSKSNSIFIAPEAYVQIHRPCAALCARSGGMQSWPSFLRTTYRYFAANFGNSLGRSSSFHSAPTGFAISKLKSRSSSPAPARSKACSAAYP